MDNTTENTFKVKFHRGPLHEHTMSFPEERPTFTIFGWQYESTGRRSGDFWVYVRSPRTAAMRKLLHWIVQQTGHDPRLDDVREPVRVPHRGRNEQCYCGSGIKYKRCHLGGAA